MIEKLPESEPEKEVFKRVELEIEPPNKIHNNWCVSFECDGIGTCAAYNASILKVSTERRMAPFHQAGTAGKTEHDPGYHKWEFWVKTDEQQLKGFCYEVQQVVEKKFDDNEAFGMNQYWKEKMKE